MAALLLCCASASAQSAADKESDPCISPLLRDPLPECPKRTESELLEALSSFDLTVADGPARLRELLGNLRGCNARSAHDTIIKWLSTNGQGLRLTKAHPKISTADAPIGRKISPRAGCPDAKDQFRQRYIVRLPYGPVWARIFSPRWYQKPCSLLVFRLFGRETLPITLWIDDENRLLSGRAGRLCKQIICFGERDTAPSGLGYCPA